MAWETFGPFDPSSHVHHRDLDGLNNDPSNLVVMTVAEHKREHRTRSVAPPSEEKQHRIDETLRLNALGWKNRDIAEHLGCTATAVSRVLMKNGRAPSTKWMLR